MEWPVPSARPGRVRFDPVLCLAAMVAVALPTLLASSVPPAGTFNQQALSFLGWGVWAMVLARYSADWPGQVWQIGGWLAGATGIFVLVLAPASWVPGLPGASSLAWALVGAAVLAGLMGWWCGRDERGMPGFAAMAFALVVAGLAGLLLGMVQVFWPQWADGSLISPSSVAGKAMGNLRQPNQLGTLMVWACIAAVWLSEAGLLRQRTAWSFLVALVFGIVLTASRTAVLGLLVLVAWAMLDRQLSRPMRRALLALPLAYVLAWAGMSAASHWAGQPFGAEARLHSSSDISSSRFRIWANTLALIGRYPWTGVGWGEFNHAWTLSVFPTRPVAFFDHTHNLPMQLAVELGLPAAVLLLGVGLWAMWRARGAVLDRNPRRASMARASLLVLLIVLIHSMLEYPLWYPYFLFPAAWFVGCYLSLGHPAGASPSGRAGRARAWNLAVGASGLMIVVAGGAVVWDYQRVVQIYAPYGEDGSLPLDERIERGRQSRLFGHHADYAKATMAEPPSLVFEAFERPLHHLIDARLMVAYARALAERGERDKAIYVAQRLREFRHPLGQEFFSVCSMPGAAEDPSLFQCVTDPVLSLSLEDFRTP